MRVERVVQYRDQKETNVSYAGMIGARVVKRGRVNATVSGSSRFSPTGPEFPYTIKVPLAHILRTEWVEE